MIGLSSSPVDAPELGHTQGWPTSGESGHPEQSGLWVARPVTVSWGSGLEKLSCRLADGSRMLINPPPPPVIRQDPRTQMRLANFFCRTVIMA